MIQNKYKRWHGGVLLFSFVLLFVNAGTALGQSSANYKIKKFVLDQGGAPSQSTNYKVVESIGQPSPVTVANSANYSVASGFFAGGEAVQTPVLLVTPTTLDFGATQTSLIFQISNSGSGALTWNVSENPDKPWIKSVSPASGNGNATVTVSVDRSGLSPGDYSGKVTVTSNGGNQDVTINMNVVGASNNILVNGDFSNGETGWLLFVAPEATASGGVQNGEYAVSITNGSNANWHIQLLQTEVLIENGKTYSVSFEAYAASPRQIGFYVKKDSAPHTVYSGYKKFSLTAIKQMYGFTFTMNEPTDNVAAFSFDLGNSNDDVFFDNVTLTEGVVQTPVLAVNPTTLDFGTTETSKTLQISNSGSGTLTWSVSENPDKPWITSVTPASGSDGATVTVNVDRTQLAGSSDTGTLEVNSNGGAQNVNVLITKPGGQATITPDAPATAQAGQEFWVAVVVNQASNLFGVSLDLSYPTTYLN